MTQAESRALHAAKARVDAALTAYRRSNTGLNEQFYAAAVYDIERAHGITYLGRGVETPPADPFTVAGLGRKTPVVPAAKSPPKEPPMAKRAEPAPTQDRAATKLAARKRAHFMMERTASSLGECEAQLQKALELEVKDGNQQWIDHTKENLETVHDLAELVTIVVQQLRVK